MRSTLRRNAMATPASVHCVSHQLLFDDLSCTGLRRKVWHFWIWILRSRFHVDVVHVVFFVRKCALTRFDKLSSRCAESEVIMARKLLPVCDTLGPCRPSCTCVDSNLDPFRPSHPLRLLLLKCVNVETTLVEFIDFDFWFNNRWFRVKIVSICILGFVFSIRTTIVGVLLAPTVFRVVSALLSLYCPCCPCCPCLPCFPLPLPNAPMSIGSSPPGCDEPFCFTLRAFV